MKSGTDQSFGRGEIRSFTGLRGCAAVLVMLYHFTFNMPAGSIPMRGFLHNGYLWVDLFFILSGFVMAYSQAQTFARGYRFRDHVAFLMARLARIYPLYAVVIAESACLVVWRTPHLDTHVFLRTLLLNFGLVQTWGLAPSLEGSAWSISTEWAAYLIFPLLMMLAVLWSRWVGWLVCAAVILTITILAMSPGPFAFADQSRSGPLDIYSSATAAPLARCIAEFTLGLLAFRVARLITSRPHAWTGPLALVTMALILMALSQPGLDVGVVALFGVLLVVLAPGTGSLARFLGAGIPYRLGQWSYSIYLIHDKFSHPTEALTDMMSPYSSHAPLVAVGLMSCLVIGCGGLTFLFIERPLRNWLLRRIRRTPGLSGELASPIPAPQRVNALG